MQPLSQTDITILAGLHELTKHHGGKAVRFLTKDVHLAAAASFLQEKDTTLSVSEKGQPFFTRELNMLKSIEQSVNYLIKSSHQQGQKMDLIYRHSKASRKEIINEIKVTQRMIQKDICMHGRRYT